MTHSLSSYWEGITLSGFRVKAIVLLISFLFIPACVAGHNPKAVVSEDSHHSLPEVQKFTEQIRQRYAPDEYVIGIGQGDSERAAIEIARGDLAKKIQVRVASLSSDVVRVEGVETHQEFGRIVTTQSDIFLHGIVTVEKGRDLDSDLAYAAVVLPIAEIDRLTEPQQPSEEETAPTTLTGDNLEPIWVTAEGIVPFGNNTTLAEAASQSRDLARRQAIEKALGVFVKAQTVVHNTNVAEETVHSSNRGIVVEEQILEQGIRAVDEGTSPKAWVYATTLRTKVKPIPTTEPTDFKVEVLLNRTVFHEGEEIQVGVIPSQDAYVYILNVKQDDGVNVLFPNKFSDDNFLTAQQKLIFPSEDQRQKGIRLRVALPPGQPQAIEKLKIIATLERLTLTPDNTPKRVIADQANNSFMMTDLMKQLALLEGTAWTEMTIPYEIRQ